MLAVPAVLRALQLVLLAPFVSSEANLVHLDGVCESHSPGLLLTQLRVQAQRLAPGGIENTMQDSGMQGGARQVAASDDGLATNSTDGRLCNRGKLLPELYVLGAQKSGTTEFAVDLMDSGILSAASQRVHSGLEKEWHFFEYWLVDHDHYWQQGLAMEDWYNALPACDDIRFLRRERVILADFTPSNLRFVPLGENMQRSGPSAFGHTDVAAVNLPVSLHRFYGDLSNRVTFVVLMREPLSRMQSAWYHSQAWKARHGRTMPGMHGSSFQEDLLASVDEAEEHRLSMLMWGSLYGRQLHGYLSEFHASQFVLVPYKYYTEHAEKEVCAALASRIEYHISCKHIREGAWVPNSHAHPSLQEDVSPELLRRFNDFIAPENALLEEVLLRAFNEGATLPAFHPDGPPDHLALRAWLTAGW